MRYKWKVAIGLTICVGGLFNQWFIPNMAVQSFRNAGECRWARTTIPFEICTVPEWRALNAEINVATQNAYGLYRDADGAKDVLIEVNRDLMSTRMYRAIFDEGDSIANLKPTQMSERMIHNPVSLDGAVFVVRALMQADEPGRRMKRHLAFLKSLKPPRPGIKGHWANAYSSIAVNTPPLGPARASVTAVSATTRAIECRALLQVLASEMSPTHGEPSLVLSNRDGALHARLLNWEKLDCQNPLAFNGAYLPIG
jgi:hypothetical protein